MPPCPLSPLLSNDQSEFHFSIINPPIFFQYRNFGQGKLILRCEKKYYYCIKDFLTSYAIDLMLIVAERIYLDPELKRISSRIPVYKAQIQARLQASSGNPNEASRYRQYAQDIEDSVTYMCLLCADTS